MVGKSVTEDSGKKVETETCQTAAKKAGHMENEVASHEPHANP